MTNIIKALVLGAALTFAHGAASADDVFTAEFRFSREAPVSVTYKRFEKTAKRACRISPRDAGGVRMKMKIEKACRAQLIQDAVVATGLSSLVAYHEEKTNPVQPQRQFARR